jgi:DNA-binding transcriptional ArsR family regulator
MPPEDAFKALADPTRRRVLQLLQGGPQPAGRLAEQFEISWPSFSRHLSVLRAAGLVRAERSGQRVIYSLNREAVMAVTEQVQEATRAEPMQLLPSPGEMDFRRTPQTEGIMRACLEEAALLGASRCGTHHVLLAVLKDDTSVAAHVASSAGLTYPVAREAAIRLFGSAKPATEWQNIPFEWEAKDLISGTVYGTAMRLGHRTISSGTYLVSLLREDVPAEDQMSRVPGNAARVIAECGTNVLDLRDTLQARLTEQPALDDLTSEVEYLRIAAAANHERAWTQFVGLERLLAEVAERVNRLEAEEHR